MKIYKNPYVSYDSYFVKTGKAPSHGKFEASASKGYNIHNMNGKWEVSKVAYYDSALNQSLSGCHPIVAENRVSIDKVIEQAVLDAVLGLLDKKED